MEASIGKFLSVAGYGFAGVLGVVGANYISTAVGLDNTHPLIEMSAGLIVMAIPTFLVHDNSGIMGATRLLLGVAGMTLLLRGLLAPAVLNVNLSSFSQIGAVV
jgi:hypothetical protein